MDDQREIYEKILKTWGEDSQIRASIEEMSELIHALMRYTRELNTLPHNENELLKRREAVTEEIADVLNMTEQLRFIFGEEKVDKIRREKLDRVLCRLTKAGENV